MSYAADIFCRDRFQESQHLRAKGGKDRREFVKRSDRGFTIRVKDRCRPARSSMDHATVELDTESVADIATAWVGLRGHRAGYLALQRHDGAMPASVPLDTIGKAAGLLERMATEKVPTPKPCPPRLLRPTRSVA